MKEIYDSLRCNVVFLDQLYFAKLWFSVGVYTFIHGFTEASFSYFQLLFRCFVWKENGTTLGTWRKIPGMIKLFIYILFIRGTDARLFWLGENETTSLDIATPRACIGPNSIPLVKNKVLFIFQDFKGSDSRLIVQQYQHFIKSFALQI